MSTENAFADYLKAVERELWNLAALNAEHALETSDRIKKLDELVHIIAEDAKKKFQPTEK